MYINICFILCGLVNSYKINSLFFNHNSYNQNCYNRIAQFNINMREVNTMMKLNESNIFNITDMNELTRQWIYTAITRSKGKVYMVNYPR